MDQLHLTVEELGETGIMLLLIQTIDRKDLLVDLEVDLVLMREILKHQKLIEEQEIHHLNLHHKEIQVDEVDMAVVVAVVLALLQVITLQQVHIMVDMVLMVVLALK